MSFKNSIPSYLRSEGDINLSSKRLEWQEEFVSEESREILVRDTNAFMHQSLSTPCLHAIKGCNGTTFTDLDGRTYYDFHGNNVHHIGYKNVEVIQAIVQQMQLLTFSPRRYTNLPAIELAEKLIEKTNQTLSRVLFAPSGSIAMGMALKIARKATGRYKTISLWDSFHGASLDMISLGGEATFRYESGPLLSGCEHAPPPNPSDCIWECGDNCNLKCASYIEYILEKERDVAAVVAETVRSTPYFPPKEYWQTVRKACDKYGALLILDEIPHGLGRTAAFFTYQHYDIVPDILVIGKALGGGILPLAATICKESLNVAGSQSLGHYTHEKNPVLCAAGLATINYIDKHKLVEHSKIMGELALSLLYELQQKYNCIGGVRGKGLMLGVDIVEPKSGFAKDADFAEKILYQCLANGLSFKITMGSTLLLTPALTITESELKDAISILDLSIHQLLKK